MQKSPSLVEENITFFYSSAILKNQILFFIQQSRSLYRKVNITQPRDIEDLFSSVKTNCQIGSSLDDG